ncbi:hypothetical protein C8R44DRAFT_675801 [Mycena epipterygia]|nr:hypothetical protein C8R44DRAFT_675801 [Mycena epipterygia]
MPSWNELRSSAIERTKIKDFCAEGSERISKISAEISIDWRRLMSSTGRHVALKEMVEPYYALLSPMRAIPPEILQEIFMACLPQRHNALMHAGHAPLLLGRVCSAWRTISLSTAALWSSVHVVVPSQDSFHLTEPGEDIPPVSDALQLCEALRTWLQRSGSCPLSISMFIPRYHLETTPRPFVDTIASYRCRWKTLQLIQVTHDSFPSLWDLRPVDVPLLETIDIVDVNPHSEPEHLGFLTAPVNLRSVSLNFLITRNVGIPTCSWDRITTLALESRASFFTLDEQQAMEIVAQCVNLQSCRLAFPLLGDPNTAVSSTSAIRGITLSHLEMLTVKAELTLIAPFNIGRILDSLVLPALQELELQGNSSRSYNAAGELILEPSSDMMLALEDLVMRSSCTLRALTLRLVTGDVAPLLRCLERSSALKTLTLDCSGTYSAAEQGSPAEPDMLHVLKQPGAIPVVAGAVPQPHAPPAYTLRHD